MLPSNPVNNGPNQESKKKMSFQFAQLQNLNFFQKHGMYVSQPYKYLATHLLLHCGMALHYYATFDYLHIGLKIINIIIHVSCTIVLIVLAFTDPGMIPKIFPAHEKVQYKKIPINYYRYTNLLKYFQKQFLTPVRGHNLKLKFCNSCLIYRPPRTVHCDQCGICIQKFDHHCPWIGTCVAKRNYKYFLCFISILTVLTIKLLVQTIIITINSVNWQQSPEIIAKSVINIFLCLYIFPAMGFSVFMLVLHLRFAALNVTTNQFCKQTWDSLSGNPYQKDSWFKNILKLTSLHYQGKLNYHDKIYDREHKLIAGNESSISMDERQNDKTQDNLFVNQTKMNKHHHYSSNQENNQQNQNADKKQKTDIQLQKGNIQHNIELKTHNQKPVKIIYEKGQSPLKNVLKTQQQQNSDKKAYGSNNKTQSQNNTTLPINQSIAIYDIHIKTTKSPKSPKQAEQSNSSPKRNIKTLSQQSQRSEQSVKQRQQSQDLKFISQQNQTKSIIDQKNQKTQKGASQKNKDSKNNNNSTRQEKERSNLNNQMQSIQQVASKYEASIMKFDQSSPSKKADERSISNLTIKPSQYKLDDNEGILVSNKNQQQKRSLKSPKKLGFQRSNKYEQAEPKFL